MELVMAEPITIKEMVEKKEHKMAHVLWQAAKFLVSLLEKEYGLGKAKTS